MTISRSKFFRNATEPRPSGSDSILCGNFKSDQSYLIFYRFSPTSWAHLGNRASLPNSDNEFELSGQNLVGVWGEGTQFFIWKLCHTVALFIEQKSFLGCYGTGTRGNNSIFGGKFKSDREIESDSFLTDFHLRCERILAMERVAKFDQRIWAHNEFEFSGQNWVEINDQARLLLLQLSEKIGISVIFS